MLRISPLQAIIHLLTSKVCRMAMIRMAGQPIFRMHPVIPAQQELVPMLMHTGGYSRPTTALYLSLNAPAFILTYAQTEFLLAEAAVRGWSVGASAAVHYANALSAALQTYGNFNAWQVLSALLQLMPMPPPIRWM